MGKRERRADHLRLQRGELEAGNRWWAARRISPSHPQSTFPFSHLPFVSYECEQTVRVMRYFEALQSAKDTAKITTSLSQGHYSFPVFLIYTQTFISYFKHTRNCAHFSCKYIKHIFYSPLTIPAHLFPPPGPPNMLNDTGYVNSDQMKTGSPGYTRGWFAGYCLSADSICLINKGGGAEIKAREQRVQPIQLVSIKSDRLVCQISQHVYTVYID